MPVLIGIQNLVLALIKFSKINSCILKIFAAKVFIVGSDVFLSVIVWEDIQCGFTILEVKETDLISRLTLVQKVFIRKNNRVKRRFIKWPILMQKIRSDYSINQSLFSFVNTGDSNVQYNFLPITGIEPRTSGFGSDRSTNWVTTTAQTAYFTTTNIYSRFKRYAWLGFVSTKRL